MDDEYSSNKDIVMYAEDIPPLGMNLYYITSQVSQNKNNNENTQSSNLTFGTKVGKINVN